MMSIRRFLGLLVWFVLAAPGVACFPEQRPESDSSPASGGRASSTRGGATGQGGKTMTNTGRGGADASGGKAPQTGKCLTAHGSEDLVAREAVMSEEVAPTDREVFVNDLFVQFKSYCGGCHVETNLGGFQVTRGNFSSTIDAAVLDRIRSDDPTKFMPPANSSGLPWSERTRAASDGLVQLVDLIEKWMAAGRPVDLFTVPNETTGNDNPYLLSVDVGTRLTNIGNCIPEATFPFASEDERMDELDEMFAKAERAPAGKGAAEERLGLPQKLSDTDLDSLDSTVLARHGVIAYVPTYPLWSDGSAKLRHLRVPRGESIHYDAKKKEFEIPANTRFYKTFLKKIVDQNGEERFRKIETRLIVARPDAEPGQPTALYGTYIWNENESEATLLTDPLRSGEPFKDRLITYVLDEPLAQQIRGENPQNLSYELQFRKAIRHYAVPGSERCVQCHMGSSNQSFVLGFTPMQLRMRPKGEGGVIEEVGVDELDQLDRLISYGVVSGLDGQDEVPLLEESQGERTPRTEQELVAQGYMFGNCAHCHNPRGFPSLTSPELAPLLNFFPSEEGGIFRFPLERFSPRITRGPNGDVPIPYISPSLRDYYPAYQVGQYSETSYYTPKFTYLHTPQLVKHPTKGVIDVGPTTYTNKNAPWRSLIYRNVQTPFTYDDDFVIFPHMPMNTAGFDCRAPRIMGEWMVSIPAERKHPEILESVMADEQADLAKLDLEPQTYREVEEGSDGYRDAVDMAEKRLALYREDDQYAECPDASDILDPSVNPPSVIVPKGVRDPASGDRVPNHAHWVVTDLSERPGDWQPRRPDWEDVLIRGQFPTIPSGSAYDWMRQKQEAERKVVELLANVTITQELKDFAMAPFPLGLYQKKPECDFTGVPTKKSFASHPSHWMDSSVADDAPIFTPLPGQAVYDMICVNCHGKRADSRGRQADTIQILTGGDARVANFMIGLFGPEGDPGENRARVFGSGVSGSVSADDLGARYLAWMALGGTQRQIPATVLALVARTDVAGVPRPSALIGAADASPNMLASARVACGEVLPISNNVTDLKDFRGVESKKLIAKNGDAELWQKLCSLGNVSVVRGVDASADENRLFVNGIQLYRGDAYPAGAPVGTHNGEIVGGLTKDNLFPWCVLKNPAPKESWVAKGINGKPLPMCPDPVVQKPLTDADREAFQTRGAVNAGLAVFLYLDQVARGKQTVRYNECELLTKP